MILAIRCVFRMTVGPMFGPIQTAEDDEPDTDRPDTSQLILAAFRRRLRDLVRKDDELAGPASEG